MTLPVMITGEPDYTGVTHSTVTQMGDDEVRVGDKALAGQMLRLCADTCTDLSAAYDKDLSAGDTRGLREDPAVHRDFTRAAGDHY